MGKKRIFVQFFKLIYITSKSLDSNSAEKRSKMQFCFHNFQ
jgi:hypothetical protein